MIPLTALTPRTSAPAQEEPKTGKKPWRFVRPFKTFYISRLAFLEPAFSPGPLPCPVFARGFADKFPTACVAVVFATLAHHIIVVPCSVELLDLFFGSGLPDVFSLHNVFVSTRPGVRAVEACRFLGVAHKGRRHHVQFNRRRPQRRKFVALDVGRIRVLYLWFVYF